MNKKTTVIAAWLVVELGVTAWIGYKIATAKERGWAVKPKRKKNPMIRTQAVGSDCTVGWTDSEGEFHDFGGEPRGQRQRIGHAVSKMNVTKGEFEA